MAPTMAKTKPKGTKKAATRPSTGGGTCMVKFWLNGKNIIDGEYPLATGIKMIRDAWTSATTTRATKTNKAAVRGAAATRTRS